MSEAMAGNAINTEAKAERRSDVLLHELHNEIGRLRDLSRRVEHVASALMGAEPKAVEEQESPPDPANLNGHMEAVVHLLQGITNDIESSLERINRFI